MAHIHLEDHLAAALANRARERGLSLEEYLSGIAAAEQSLSTARISGIEAVRLIEFESGPGNRDYKGSYSREDIYIDQTE
jgi:hypothetical protein